MGLILDDPQALGDPMLWALIGCAAPFVVVLAVQRAAWRWSCGRRSQR